LARAACRKPSASSQIRSRLDEPGDIGTLTRQPADRVGGSYTDPPRVGLTWRMVSSSAMSPGVRQRPVELDHHQ
jgi:hypothetical protein